MTICRCRNPTISVIQALRDAQGFVRTSLAEQTWSVEAAWISEEIMVASRHPTEVSSYVLVFDSRFHDLYSWKYQLEGGSYDQYVRGLAKFGGSYYIVGEIDNQPGGYANPFLLREDLTDRVAYYYDFSDVVADSWYMFLGSGVSYSGALHFPAHVDGKFTLITVTSGGVSVSYRKYNFASNEIGRFSRLYTDGTFLYAFGKTGPLGTSVSDSAWVAKFDSSLSVLFFEGSIEDNTASVSVGIEDVCSDDDYVYLAQSGSTNSIFKLSSTGSGIWEKEISISGWSDSPPRLISVDDNYIYVLCYQQGSYPSGGSVIALICLDKTGAIIDAKELKFIDFTFTPQTIAKSGERFLLKGWDADGNIVLLALHRDPRLQDYASEFIEMHDVDVTLTDRTPSFATKSLTITSGSEPGISLSVTRASISLDFEIDYSISISEVSV